MEVFKEFNIDAAHRLPNVSPEHKCGRLHGHSFRVEIHVRGAIGSESGMGCGLPRYQEGVCATPRPT